MATGKLIDSFTTPAFSGVIGALATPLVFNTSYNDYLNAGLLQGWNASLGVGILIFGSSLIGHLSKNYVLPMIPQNSYFAEGEGRVLTPVLTGLASSAILYTSTDRSFMALGKTFLLGAVSEVSGDYINRTFLSQYM